MQFRLVYDGVLKASANDKPRAAEKHAIRRELHKQLRALWSLHPYLRDGYPTEESPRGAFGPGTIFHTQMGKISEYLAERYSQFGFRFVPLVRPELALLCDLNILFLRRQQIGGLLHDGDIDGRLKTLFDALRMPKSEAELAGSAPGEGEDPFYVLLTDDSLVTGVSVTTDDYLSGENLPNGSCRLIIHADIRPYFPVSSNQSFG